MLSASSNAAIERCGTLASWSKWTPKWLVSTGGSLERQAIVVIWADDVCGHRPDGEVAVVCGSLNLDRKEDSVRVGRV